MSVQQEKQDTPLLVLVTLALVDMVLQCNSVRSA